jgi:hypothetical protein
MDEVRIYNRALNDSEIESLYASRAGITKSLDIQIETVRLKLHLFAGKSYILQSSADLKIWNDYGSPFVATAPDQSVSVNNQEGTKLWRVAEAP